MAKRVAILGAGSWALAVSKVLLDNGNVVSLWEFDAGECERLRETRLLPNKLPGFELDASVMVTNNIAEAVEACDLIVLAVPSQSLRSALTYLKPHLSQPVPLVNLAKGVENDSYKRMSQVVVEELGCRESMVATISGPSHAEEVAVNVPTTVVAAGNDAVVVQSLQDLFSNQFFRVYSSDDLVGVELGGSLKNIIAIGVGIADGLGMGDNTRGALITRGLAEITRLGLAMGARAETFAGLSGIGDLVTTCTSRHSRNRFVGEKIGQGQTLKNILEEMHQVAEGVATTRSGFELAEQVGVEMPITGQVYRVLFENKLPLEAVSELMGRTLKAELWR